MRIDYVVDYVIFDLETTGLSIEKDAIIEISALKVINGEVKEEFSELVNPGFHIPYYASSINGIMDDMVKDAPGIETVLKCFIDFIGDYVLVGHNIKRFDLNFIKRDAKNYFGRTISNDYIDTLFLARLFLPDLQSHSLESLANHYNISYEGAHRALTDCYINKRIYDQLKKEKNNP